MRSTTGWTGVLLLLPLGGAAPAEPRAPVTVPFQLLPTQHITVQVMVNGKGPYRMIFDTGSPVNLLSARVGRDARLLQGNSGTSVLNAGLVGQVMAKTLAVGAVRADDMPVVVMDHPSLQILSKLVGPVEGIIGLPFYGRYRMTLDYQKQQLTFEPNGYRPPDALKQTLQAVTAWSELGGQSHQMLTPAALWGMTLAKQPGDDKPGVAIEKVFAEGAAARAGLRPGDRLLSLDGRWTDSIADVYRAAARIAPQQLVEATIERGPTTLHLQVRPQSGL